MIIQFLSLACAQFVQLTVSQANNSGDSLLVASKDAYFSYHCPCGECLSDLNDFDLTVNQIEQSITLFPLSHQRFTSTESSMHHEGHAVFDLVAWWAAENRALDRAHWALRLLGEYPRQGRRHA